MRRDAWAYGAALVVLSLLLAGTVFVVPYLPTTDGPEWVFTTHAENHYSDPGAPYSEAFVPTLQFASRGFGAVYAPFEDWLGWQLGLQVTLSLVLLATAWGFVALVHSVDPARRAVALLGFPLALTWSFYMGFWPLSVSSAIGLFVLAFWVKKGVDATPVRRAALAAMLLVQAVAHVFGAVLVGGVVLVLAVVRARPGTRLRELACTTLTGLPAAGVLAACVVASARASHPPGGTVQWHDALLVLPQVIAPGPLWRACIVTLGVLASGVLVTARAFRSTTGLLDRALGTVAIAFLLAGALAPCRVPGWMFFSQRFVPLGVGLAFVALPLERLDARRRTWVFAGAFVASVAWLGTTLPFHRRLVALVEDAIAGLGAPVRTRGHIMAAALRISEDPSHLYFRSEIPFSYPLAHMGVLYATVLGGIPEVSYAWRPAVHAFKRRPRTRPIPDENAFTRARETPAFEADVAYRDAVETALLLPVGVSYDEVVVFAAEPSDFRLWEEHGYVMDWRGAKTFVAHFAPDAAKTR